jgi:hypothetical protein
MPEQQDDSGLEHNGERRGVDRIVGTEQHDVRTVK